MYWSYSALTRSGREVLGSFRGNRKELADLLSQKQLHPIDVSVDLLKSIKYLCPKKSLSTLTMAVFFEDISNMLLTGLSLSEIILILKETSSNDLLSDLLMQFENDLLQGKSLSESIIDTKVFPWIVSVTISSAERTGRLQGSCLVLAKYFREAFEINHKIKQALVYPSIVFVILISIMFFISIYVIPQLKNLLPTDSLDHQSTQGILFISFILQHYLWVLVLLIFLLIFGIHYFRKYDPFGFLIWLYTWPFLGNIVKESTIALYLLNLSVLLKSAVPLIKAIGDLNALDKTPVSHHFAISRDYMLGGTSFWQSIEQDDFFPAIIPTTLRRAEEMTKLDEYCLSLSEFFNKRCALKLDRMIQLIQPALLAIGGAFLIMIALAFILPIYGSLSTIATGQ